MDNNMRTANEGSKASVAPKRRINKWIYILLALCLGSLGLHNFYSGNYIIGIIWLALFCLGFLLSFIGIGWIIFGFLWLIAIIQAIVMLCRFGDADGYV